MASALGELAIIDKKFIENLAIGRVIKVTKPTLPCISLSLTLIPKHNEGWEKIYQLFYPQGDLVNSHILNRTGELKYIYFQEIFKLII